VPSELRAGKDEVAVRLKRARWLGPGPVRRLRVEHGRVQLDTRVRDGCLSYEVGLSEGGSLDAAVRRVGRDLLASPNVWLWRPERRARDARATLRLHLPPQVRALVPWPARSDGVRILDAEAFRFDSYAAFGRFTTVETTEGDVRIEAARLDGALAIDDAALLRWLRSAIGAASQSASGLPHKQLSALVVPSGEGTTPVPFGMVARGGAASVLLLVGASAREDELVRDWVLPHELSHLLLPFVEREHAWLSEGLATYYQELVRARAGLVSERDTWQHIRDALTSAASESTDASVVRESARMHLTRSYTRVYWGGAAYWLGVDVALRTHSAGHASLDDVLAALRAEGALHDVWRARELIARLDALTGTTIFASAWAEAEARAFPAYEATLAQLGVRAEAGRVQLDDGAPLAELRRALIAPRR
jgi:hypothetical protein